MSFKTKKSIKLVTFVSGTKVDFDDRLAYSFLLARSKGFSIAGLAKASGLDRTATLPKVLVRLVAQGLAKKDGTRYQAVPSNLVRLDSDRQAADTWYEQVCYLKYYLPSDSCPFTKKQLAVYYLMLSGKTGASLIATILGVSRSTVVRAVKVLTKHGLLDALGDPVALNDPQLGWWLDKSRVAPRAKEQFADFASMFAPLIQVFEHHQADWIAVHPWKNELNTFGTLCGKYGYKCDQVVKLLETTAMHDLHGKAMSIARVFRELPKLVRKAEENTEKNRRNGSYKGSSFGTFKKKLQDLVRAEKQRAISESRVTR